MRRTITDIPVTMDDLVELGVIRQVRESPAEKMARVREFMDSGMTPLDAAMQAARSDYGNAFEDRDRLLAFLHIYMGHSMNSLSKKFGIGPNTVARWAHRGDCQTVRDAYMTLLMRHEKEKNHDA